MVATSIDPQLAKQVATQMLDVASTSDDKVLTAITSGKQQALQLIAAEQNNIGEGKI